MCTSGSLMALVAIGLADAVLTGSPVGTYWHFQHKSYTNFSLEVDRNSFNSGVAQFGAAPKYNVDRVGDLVYFIYIEALIPGLALPFPRVGAGQVILTQNSGGNGTNGEPYWTKDVGHAMIEKAQVFIGGQCIDEVFSEFMYIWEEISGQPGKHLIEMTGNYEAELTLQIASRQPRVLYIPLPFWFTQNSGNALPIVSLQFHSVQLQVYFRPLQSLLKLPWVSMNDAVKFPAGVYVISDILSRPKFIPALSTSVQPLSDCSTLSSSSLTANILITYVYLDQRERSQFADGQFETLINQHQAQATTGSQTVANVNTYGSSDVGVVLDLNFNHPVYEFYVVARLANHNACTNNCLEAQFNEWFNFCGPRDTITDAPIDPVVTLQLKLNNANRFPDLLEGRYFRLVEPWQWHTNIVQTNCIYTYSMSLQPEDVQPAGSTNFSRIDNAKLYIGLDRRCFTGPSIAGTPPSAANPPANSVVDVLVFVQNWNILRFKYGLGGLRFAA